MTADYTNEFGKFDGFIYKPRVPLNSLVNGIGVNDAPFITQPKIEGKSIRHPAYITWSNILKRCYSDVYQKQKPTYVGVTCCKEWLLFTNFAKWFKDNYIEGYQLDKDLLVKDNLIYSPDTCIFVPSFINSFIVTRGRDRGELPLGVGFKNNKYSASISVVGTQHHIGYFSTQELAHQAWQKAKLEQAIAFNFPPLQRVIDQLKFEIENNLETISL